MPSGGSSSSGCRGRRHFVWIVVLAAVYVVLVAWSTTVTSFHPVDGGAAPLKQNFVQNRNKKPKITDELSRKRLVKETVSTPRAAGNASAEDGVVESKIVAVERSKPGGSKSNKTNTINQLPDDKKQDQDLYINYQVYQDRPYNVTFGPWT